MGGQDPFNLQRFIDAQNGWPHTYAQALSEINAGAKRSCWIWYIFPQFIDPARSSANNTKFQLHGRAEALAYLRNDTLRPRLERIARAVEQQLRKNKVDIVMGSDVDAKKLHQSVTVFRLAAQEAGSGFWHLSSVLTEILSHIEKNPYAKGLRFEDPVMKETWERDASQRARVPQGTAEKRKREGEGEEKSKKSTSRWQTNPTSASSTSWQTASARGGSPCVATSNCSWRPAPAGAAAPVSVDSRANIWRAAVKQIPRESTETAALEERKRKRKEEAAKRSVEEEYAALKARLPAEARGDLPAEPTAERLKFLRSMVSEQVRAEQTKSSASLRRKQSPKMASPWA